MRPASPRRPPHLLRPRIEAANPIAERPRAVGNVKKGDDHDENAVERVDDGDRAKQQVEERRAQFTTINKRRRVSSASSASPCEYRRHKQHIGEKRGDDKHREENRAARAERRRSFVGLRDVGDRLANVDVLNDRHFTRAQPDKLSE